MSGAAYKYGIAQCCILGGIMGLLSSCASEKADGIALIGTGNVMDVMEGRPPADDVWIDLSSYRAAFEAGSPQGVSSIGEFIGFNGLGYTRSTEDSSRGELLVGKKITTNAAVFLHKDASPSRVIEISQPSSVAALAERLTQEEEGPVCYVGVVTFEQFHSTAIQRAPIYNQNIFDHSESYYPDAPTTVPQVRAAIMGCAASQVSDGKVDLGVVVYRNPNDPSGSVLSHTHALSIRGAAEVIDDIEPANAEQVHHVFGDSVIAGGKVEVFRVGSVRMLDNQ